VRAGCGPLEHGQVTVGVPGGHDRALPDMPVDRGLLGPIVDDLDSSALDEFGPASADAELDFPTVPITRCGGRPKTSAAQARTSAVPPPEKIQQEKPLRSSRPIGSSIGW
jgi:hypothetical protein